MVGLGDWITHTHNASHTHTTCFWPAYDKPITPTWHAYHTHMTCISHAHDKLITLTRHAHHTHITRTRHAYHTHMTSWSHSHDMLITCTWQAYHMHTTCLSHAHITQPRIRVNVWFILRLFSKNVIAFAVQKVFMLTLYDWLWLNSKCHWMYC